MVPPIPVAKHVTRLPTAWWLLFFLLASGLGAPPAAAASSYQFDGSSTLIDHGTAADLDLPTALTVCAWVKSDLPDAQQTIAGRSANPTHVNPFEEYGLAQASGASNRISFSLSTGAPGSLAQAVTDALPDITRWNWVCGAWDATLQGGLMDIYLNGTEAASYVSHPVFAGPTGGTGESFRAGGTAAGTELWAGRMAYLQLWSRKLSAAEIQETMHHPGARRQGLRLYSPMTSQINFPQTPVLDTFNRTNGLIGENDPSSTNWTHSWSLFDPNQVTITLENGQVRSTQGDANGGSEAWNPLKATNLEAYYNLTALQRPNTCTALILRHPVVSDCHHQQYSCEFCLDNFQLWVENGGNTKLVQEALVQALKPGDQPGMRVVGSTVECYLNGSLIASTQDDQIQNPGYISLFITNSASARADNFGGGRFNAIRDLSGNGHHTTSGGILLSPDGPPVTGGAR